MHKAHNTTCVLKCTYAFNLCTEQWQYLHNVLVPTKTVDSQHFFKNALCLYVHASADTQG